MIKPNHFGFKSNNSSDTPQLLLHITEATLEDLLPLNSSDKQYSPPSSSERAPRSCRAVLGCWMGGAMDQILGEFSKNREPKNRQLQTSFAVPNL